MTARRICDGPSCRSVTKFRELNSVKWFVTVRRIYDGPCCNSIVKFRESIPVPRFQSWSVLERKPSTDRCAYDGLSYLSSRVMRRAAEEITQVWDDKVHHGPSWPWWSVAWSVDPVSFYHKWFYCSKWLNRLLHPYLKNDYDHQNNISKNLWTDKQQSQRLKNLSEAIYIIMGWPY